MEPRRAVARQWTRRSESPASTAPDPGEERRVGGEALRRAPLAQRRARRRRVLDRHAAWDDGELLAAGHLALRRVSPEDVANAEPGRAHLVRASAQVVDVEVAHHALIPLQRPGVAEDAPALALVDVVVRPLPDVEAIAEAVLGGDPGQRQRLAVPDGDVQRKESPATARAVQRGLVGHACAP